MHISSYSSSYEVIEINNILNKVINNTAVLGASQSKYAGRVIKVSLERCVNDSKPPSIKPSLIYLNKAKKRLKWLD